jgi:uncharacterized protein (DUF305 family)
MRSLIAVFAVAAVSAPLAGLAQQMPGMSGMDHHMHHGGGTNSAPSPQADHAAHMHDVGPAGATYDLRFIDGMVQHHTGALRMSEYVFDIGVPGVGSLGKEIWNDQSQEIKAMGQWRKAWYPDAPVYPVTYLPGGDPNSLSGVKRMTAEQIAGMRMMESIPTKSNRVTWFLEGMLQHHGGALIMAHDALLKSTNPTILRLARNIIIAQRREIVQIRKMLQYDGLNKPEYYQYDGLFYL